MKRCAIVASSNGSVFQKVYDISEKIYPGQLQFYVFTDRPCGIENFCREKGIIFKRIDQRDRIRFSQELLHICREYQINFVLLFFLRIVSNEIYENFPTFNIHPSLLPAFSGFKAIERAKAHGVKFIGATLHLVSGEIDGGKIVAQTVSPLKHETSEIELLNKMLFLHKVYLAMNLICMIQNDILRFNQIFSEYQYMRVLPSTLTCNPAITDTKVIDEFDKLQQNEGMEVLI